MKIDKNITESNNPVSNNIDTFKISKILHGKINGLDSNS